jgi:3-methyl-2-oxobutanoate hydroxymethyltransferase
MPYTTPKSDADSKPVTVSSFAKWKAAGEKFSCLTAYDASFAALEDQNGIDLVLVGDSLGMVVQGHATTVPVTMDDCIYHLKAVARGLTRAHLMADMPFHSYPTPERALDNAVRMLQEGGAASVKLEGSADQAGIVEYLARHDVPVCAHLGLKPQAVHKLGGFKVQGREADAAAQLKRDARHLEDAGADFILLECVPAALAAEVTALVKVPVIGIGAGKDVDGQILVVYDMLDITPGRRPKFVRNFMAGNDSPAAAVRAFVQAVKDGSFPGPEHVF